MVQFSLRAVTHTDTRGSLGVSTGFPSLLSTLETALGLVGAHFSNAERLALWLGAMEQTVKDGHPYHRSFAKDPLGTASLLLNCRDEWRLAGWNGLAPESDPPARLKAIVELEAQAGDGIANAEADRLTRVLQALDDRPAPLSSIQLWAPRKTLPGLWQQVINKLEKPAKGAPCKVDESEPTYEPAGGYLGQIQGALEGLVQGKLSENHKLGWQPDDSFRVYRISSMSVASRWAATQVTDKTLVIAGDRGDALEAGFVAAGRPRAGLGEASVARPSLQIVPLALGLLWSPLDYDQLIAFLYHPLNPFGRHGRKLARHLTRTPSLLSADFTDLLEQMRSSINSDNPTDRQKRLDRFNERVAMWLSKPDPAHTDSVPVTHLTEKIKLLNRHFAGLSKADNPEVSTAAKEAMAQCALLSGVLGKDSAAITRPQLSKWLCRMVVPGEVSAAQVGAPQCVADPADVVEAHDQVLWWHASAPDIPAGNPWRADEVAALESCGATFLPPGESLEHLASTWLRPLLSASTRFTLLLPPGNIEQHPLWQMLEAVIDKPRPETIENVLALGGDGMTLCDEHKPLPKPKRWWTVDDATATRLVREGHESWSSLEKFIEDPHQWVLAYPARLKQGAGWAVNEDPAFMGTFGHALVEALCKHGVEKLQDATTFNTWFENEFRKTVETRADSLNGRGKATKRLAEYEKLKRSLFNLAKVLASINPQKIVNEAEYTGHYPGGLLRGGIDLIVDRGELDHLVLDVKSSKTDPEKRMREGRHYQLALYAHLYHQTHQRYPQMGYYILSDQSLLLDTLSDIPTAQHVIPDVTTPQLWQWLETALKWRRSLLDKGYIERVRFNEGKKDTRYDPDPDYQGDVSAPTPLDIRGQKPEYNDFAALAGWEE